MRHPDAIIPSHHVPSLRELLRAIWRHLRGVQPGWRERAKEARLVEAMAAQMEAEPETNYSVVGETNLMRQDAETWSSRLKAKPTKSHRQAKG